MRCEHGRRGNACPVHGGENGARENRRNAKAAHEAPEELAGDVEHVPAKLGNVHQQSHQDEQGDNAERIARHAFQSRQRQKGAGDIDVATD